MLQNIIVRSLDHKCYCVFELILKMYNVVVSFTYAKLHFPKIDERNVRQALLQGEQKGHVNLCKS